MPSFAESLQLMESWVESESLRRHMRSVEVAMRAYAGRFGADQEAWAIAGVLHDFDYQRFPETHPYKGVEILTKANYPAEITQAILAHATFTGAPRESLMAKALFAVDELTGLITAAVLIRPERTLAGLEPASIKKKFKDKSFAKGVNRGEIELGASELGLSLDEHLDFVLRAMQANSELLGL